MRDLDALIADMTVEEKAALTAGADNWHTVAIPRLGLPAVKLSDGPNGARGDTRNSESLTLSVCIPSGTALGATWDPELAGQASAVVARQALEKRARVLLAPTVNLHRHPLWGRNFECFSEDPYLTARMGVGYIAGVQGQGVAATVKHLVANETEFERRTSSSVVDLRTLRELYLLPFEWAVRVGGVLAVMTSYNRLNGTHLADNAEMLGDTLRGEWGFGGLVMSDWWALLETELAGRGGLDLEMPGPARAFGPALAEAVKAGTVPEADLDAKVRRMLTVWEQLGALDDEPGDEAPTDRPEDRAFIRRAAADGMVLLANDGVLPLDRGSLRRVLVAGPNATRPAVMGGGSARVTTFELVSPLDALRDALGAGVTVDYAAEGDEDSLQRAADADVVVAVVGTDLHWESEGYDRTTMKLPGDQDRLVERLLEAGRPVVVVVNTGAPVELPWARRAAAVVQAYFGGEELGPALADVLVGEAEPGGRLPTTLPICLEHTPAFGNFPGEASEVRYGEGLLMGYRWYEARHLPVAFPFGHGLSYTTFSIGAPQVAGGPLGAGGRITVEVPVTNTGHRAGAEVVQLYVAPPAGPTPVPGGRLRPVKSLQAFAKVRLAAGESTTVRLELVERSFAYYDVADEDWPRYFPLLPERAQGAADGVLHRTQPGWYVDGGTYSLEIGRSSADLVHRVPVEVVGREEPLPADAPLF
ncbi:MAG TPA: glycoside hydrolase family 3 C-terminal domain-containing protein [Acidimicrobiales bacterium]|nr:glycoside hydrolase family 3 C-terminal domain-containing protein [Acidimicrobiales bacterium]